MTNNQQCSGVTVLFTYLFYVTGLHDPVVLRTKMSMLSVGLYHVDDTTMCRDARSSDTSLVSCI